jgi:hypothetical protein
MRNSIWSVPGYADDDIDLERMEEARPQRPLRDAFLKIPGATWQAKLNHCASCKCCTRHQTFRPRDLVHWRELEEGGDGLIKLSYTKQCSCDCRHMARFICRQVEIDGTTPPCPRSPPTLDEDIA